MTLADVAVIIGGAAALVTATGALITQLVTLRSIRKVAVVAEETKHLVNSASDAAKAYNLLLSDKLREYGVNVPVDPSVVPPTINAGPSDITQEIRRAPRDIGRPPTMPHS